MHRAQGKLFAIYQRQESRRTTILGNHLRSRYIGAIYCSLKRKDCNFYQTRSNAVVFYDTLFAEFIEKATCTKTKEQRYRRESARPRVVFRAYSQCGLQDLLRREARSSWESQQDADSYGETRCNIVDYRVPGISLSTVQQPDEQRQHTVAKLIRDVRITSAQRTIS